MAKPVCERIVNKINWLAENFDQITPQPLTANLSGFFKLRVGDYRVIYEFDSEKKTIFKVLQQETQKLEQEDLSIESTQANHPPQAFLETFGSWKDTRTAEEIIDDIYSSRTVSDRNYTG